MWYENVYEMVEVQDELCGHKEIFKIKIMIKTIISKTNASDGEELFMSVIGSYRVEPCNL